MKNSISIQIKEEIPSESQEKAYFIIEQIKSLQRNIAQLRDCNLDLEKVRDQYIIHLQQCQEDRHILNEIYQSLKYKLYQTFPDCEFTTEKKATPIEYVSLNPLVTEYSQEKKIEFTLRFALSTNTIIATTQFSNNGKSFGFADSKFVYIMSYDNQNVVTTLDIPNPKQNTREMKFSPDDKMIAVSTGTDVILFSLENYTVIQRFSEHTEEVNSIFFNKENNWLITAGYDGVINIWNLSNFSLVKRLNHQNIPENHSIAKISGNDNFYVVAFVCGIIGVYDSNFSQPMRQYEANQSTLMSICVSSTDNYATSCYDATNNQNLIQLWKPRAFKLNLENQLTDHSNYIVTLEFSNDGDLLFSGSKDKKIDIWNQKNGHLLYSIEAHEETVFQIDHNQTRNSFISCDGQGFVCVWDYTLL